ncbi:SAM-dependent methyltransferase [Pseudomonas koreensis]|uniref:Tetrapyrrole Methylase n=1 Tax=Pseudomonas koreensis TaxID=198620 RepID=A0AA94ES38_9PSED|nr:SAM-dependent methyltransferase [Pseudomonas koreensis]RVD79585.1 Tetrapyrrole Methylase [Pseudomonas koreensis]
MIRSTATSAEAAPAYASKQEHAQAWEALARDIARQLPASETPPATTTRQAAGQLTIIGSGIEAMGFSVGDEALLNAADKVFYCVADPATTVWLKHLRPDALDLYVLYDDNKVRYHTYMQMSEAMLHPVRQGENVVAVFYGHPGIFVLSTHRAIAIARREGYRAVMRAGICALDCLCADLGIDPCHPGLQTHEATDMLVRDRVPDTSLHVVLWQVGLIGEMGFRREGYLNENFSILVQYLQQHYGDDYSITHYIASRYPGVAPVVEHFPLSALHDPQVQVRFTGISTFYIAPKVSRPSNREMAIRLGLLKDHEILKTPTNPQREVDRYGPRELAAIRQFESFKVPLDYHWQESTPASHFILALKNDIGLRQRFADDPGGTVDSDVFPGLSGREKRLLATGDPGAMQIAAKGVFAKDSNNKAFLLQMLRSKRLAGEVRKACLACDKGTGSQHLEEVARFQGWQFDAGSLAQDIVLLNRHDSLPWTGVYFSAAAQRLIVIIGDLGKPEQCLLYVDGQPVCQARYEKGILKWTAASGNPHNGFLRTDLGPGRKRRLIGSIWGEQDNLPAEHALIANELHPGGLTPVHLVGAHRNQLGDCLQIAVRDQQVVAQLNGRPLGAGLSISGWSLCVGDARFDLQALGAPPQLGQLYQRQAPLADEYWGSYVLRNQLADSPAVVLNWSEQGLTVNSQAVGEIRFADSRLSWSGGPAMAASGTLELLWDPITLDVVLFGSIGLPANGKVNCIGARLGARRLPAVNPWSDQGLSAQAWEWLYRLCAAANKEGGGLMLWQKWQKYACSTAVMNRQLHAVLR